MRTRHPRITSGHPRMMSGQPRTTSSHPRMTSGQPTIRRIAFAVTTAGTYRTTDAGRHWQRTTDVILRAFDFSPFRNAEVCALADWPRMSHLTADAYCSTDFGLTWTPATALFFLL